MQTSDIRKQVINAWAQVDAPPIEAMEGFEDEFGSESAEAFLGKRPVDVDIRSFGFRNASPLLSLPPSAAGAYLGTYLISLLYELELQENSGFFSDLMTRAHTLASLSRPRFWERVIRGSLPKQCYEATLLVVRHIISKNDFFRLKQENMDFLKKMLAQSPPDEN